jgi:hypothetical protein
MPVESTVAVTADTRSRDVQEIEVGDEDLEDTSVISDDPEDLAEQAKLAMQRE